MRLFVAIPLPESVKEQLTTLEKPIEGVRWQDASQMHLTLRFIGSINNETTEKVKGRLAEISQNSFEMAVNGLGQFPEEGNPRVLWAGIEHHSDLMLLQEKVEDACVKSGLDAESRDYKPHITLAKIKKKRASGTVKSFISDYSDFRINSIPVNEFILYHSKLNKDGAIHTVLNKYEFN